MSCESSGSARQQVTMEKPLFVPLCSDPYYRFKRGSKWVEIRNAKGRWNPKQVKTGRPALMRRGYSTPDEFRGVLGRVAFVQQFSELPAWAVWGANLREGDERSGFFDPDEPIVAFEVLQNGGRQEAPAYECVCGKKFEDTKALDGHILTAGEENLRELLPVQKEKGVQR